MTITMTPPAHYYDTIEGHFWFRNAYEQLLAALPTDRVSHWVEVGVFHGQSMAWLGVESVRRGIPLHIYAVDTFDGWPGTLRGAALRAAYHANTAPLAKLLGGRFQTLAMSSVEAAQWFDNASLDVVWIDADHRYAAVRADCEAWLPKLKPAGVIGGDDWSLEGVALAVRHLFDGRYMLGEGERLGEPWPWWMVRV